MPKRTLRGVKDLRTHSGQVDQTSLPHKAYMRISCLEMERARRGVERESAMVRVRGIDERFREIDEEKAALLEGLGHRTEPRTGHGARGTSAAASAGAAAGFKIKY